MAARFIYVLGTVGMRLTNEAPFSVVSLVPGGAAALSAEIQPKVRCVCVMSPGGQELLRL